MKIVQINSVCGIGSTGKICVGISKCLNKKDVENYILYNRGESNYKNAIKCSERFIKIQSLFSRIKGNFGFNSNRSTTKLINELEQIHPDIVHLHNLHSHNCNLERLILYLKMKKIAVIWTFHDCWGITAYCPHYVMANCYQWTNSCYQCPEFRKYSWFIDKSKEIYERKKKLLTDINLNIVVPSNWLKKQVKQSFLKACSTHVIYNGIDLNIFKPTSSDFKRSYNIPKEKYIILGVAIEWNRRKGPDVFIRLAKEMPVDNYQIVLVGTNEKLERQLPDNIIAIRRTSDQRELAEIYTSANIFVNPTREDTFPTVNLEANACGTPVLTFDTGGSPECIDETSGSVVPCDDYESLKKEIIRICTTKPYSSEACVKRAQQFAEESRYQEYIELYKEIYNQGK